MAAVLAKRPQDSFNQAFPDWGQTKAAYRFIENERVSVEALEAPIHEATVRRCASQKVVIAVQDTTTLVFDSARQAEGLGTVNNSPKTRGMFYHPVLGLDEEGLVLGLVHQQRWCRGAKVAHKAKDRRQRRIEDKESYKWLKGIVGTRASLQVEDKAGQVPRLIHVFDREGDVHEVFEEITSSLDGAVIRCAHNRRTIKADGELRLAHEAVRAEPVLGELRIEVPRKRGQKKRRAVIEVRPAALTLWPSKRNYPNHKSLTLNLVEVWEPAPPSGSQGLHWLLYTTEPVGNIQEVSRIVDIYKMRWKIEELFLILKSGCRIEEVQFSTASRLAKVVALYAPVAVRILQLRDSATSVPEQACTAILSEQEWRALWTHIHKTRPSQEQAPPSILQAVMWIGRMGGHLGRKSDARPGVRTLWKGLRDLSLLTEMYCQASL